MCAARVGRRFQRRHPSILERDATCSSRDVIEKRQGTAPVKILGGGYKFPRSITSIRWRGSDRMCRAREATSKILGRNGFEETGNHAGQPCGIRAEPGSAKAGASVEVAFRDLARQRGIANSRGRRTLTRERRILQGALEVMRHERVRLKSGSQAGNCYLPVARAAREQFAHETVAAISKGIVRSGRARKAGRGACYAFLS